MNSSIIRAANTADRGIHAVTQGALKAFTNGPRRTATPRQEQLFCSQKISPSWRAMPSCCRAPLRRPTSLSGRCKNSLLKSDTEKTLGNSLSNFCETKFL